MQHFMPAAALAAMIPLFCAAPLRAGGPRIDPGQWEFTTTATTPMTKGPKVTTETRCITAEDAKKDPIAELVEESQCKVTNREEDGDSIDFAIECAGDMGMKMKGTGHFEGAGTTASGTVEMSVQVPGLGSSEMKMTQEWEGKRLGDCE